MSTFCNKLLAFAVLFFSLSAHAGAPVIWDAACTSGIFNLANNSCLSSGTSPVSSVFGRTGAITAVGTDYSAFYQPIGSYVTSVTGTSPIISSGGTTPAISCQAANGTQAGCLDSTDWTTFNSKQPAGSYITGLTGDVVATGPGSVTATIQAGVVGNSKLASMANGTVKGNNSGSSGPPLDLTGTQVTALLTPFVGDTGSGGTQGVVPAPVQYTGEQGFVLGAGGSFIANDLQKTIQPSFQMISQTLAPVGDQKFENVLMIRNGLSTYAVVGGGTTKTVAIYNVTDQAQPKLRGSINLSGTYGVCGSDASWPYVFVPASGARTLTVLNIQDPNNPVVVGTPFSWTANTTSIYGCAYYNGLVFMAGQSHGLGILDVGNGVSGGTITAPVLAYDEGTQPICSVANSCKSFGVAVDGANSIVYVNDYSTATPWTYRQLKAYSFASSITAPTLLQNLTLPTGSKPTALSLNLGTKTAFVVDGNLGVVDVVDITNVSTGGMTNLSTLTPTNTFGIPSMVAASVSGSKYAYVPSGSASVLGTIDMFDLTNRASPIKVATATMSGVTNTSSVFGNIAIDPRGGYIYVGDYGNGTLGAGLDIFTMPSETLVAGNETISTLTAISSITGTVNYTPATPANWSPIPTTVKGALDTLAASIASATFANTTTFTSSYSVLGTDKYLFANSSGATTLTLPDATVASGVVLYVKNINTGTCTVTPFGAQTIDGNSAFGLNKQYQAIQLVSQGGQWWVF